MVRLKSIFSILVLVAGIYVLVRLFPIYYENFAFERAMEDQARLATYSTKSESDIAQIVAEEAAKEDIPLTADQIKVERFPGEIGISAEYTVQVSFPFYNLTLHFNPSTRNKKV